MTILKTLKIDYFLIYQAVVSFEEWNIRYKVKEIRNINIPKERRGRLMFIFLSKKETSSFNREIAEMTGGISPSGVTHQYKRILKRLKEDRRFLKEWKRESKSIMSMIKGRPL